MAALTPKKGKRDGFWILDPSGFIEPKMSIIQLPVSGI